MTPTSQDDGQLSGLVLVARAVSGRRVHVRVEPVDDGRAFVEGTTIVVPEPLTPNSARQVFVQAALIAAGSVEPEQIRWLIGRRSTTVRYLAVEGKRALHAARDLAPPNSVDALLAAAGGVPLSTGPAHSRRLARRVSAPAPEVFGRIAPLAHVRATRARGPAALLAEQGRQAAGAWTSAPAPEPDAELAWFFRSAVSPTSRVGRALRKLIGGGAGLETAAAGSANLATPPSVVPAVHPSGASPLQPPARVLEPNAKPPRRGLSFPEWDERSRSYRSNWVTARYARPPRTAKPRDLTDVQLTPSRDLERAIARALLGRVARGRTADGGELHPDSLADLAVWTRRPAGPPPPVCVGLLPARARVAVLVLLDASGSTHGRRRGTYSVFDDHVGLAHRVTSAIEHSGLPVALDAFRSWGRSNVEILTLKAPGERLGTSTANRLAELKPAGYTRMGAAIRYGADALRESAPRTPSLLLLVSDAFPYDEGYEGSYAAADTRRAVYEARALGVACVCVGVTQPESHRGDLRGALAGASAFYVASPGDIERRLGRLLARGLRDAGRRADQRVRERSSSGPRTARGRR